MSLLLKSIHASFGNMGQGMAEGVLEIPVVFHSGGVPLAE